MHSCPWQLEKDRVASLRLDRFRATLDLLRPDQGIVQLDLDAVRLNGARLLAVVTAGFPGSDSDLLVERYVRGRDLVAAYEEPASRPLRVDVRWRAVSATPSERFLAAIELIVSVRTHVLDGYPELAVQSDLPATEALRLTDAGSARYESLPSAATTPLVMQPRDRPSGLLFRLSGVEFSYAELVYPADFEHDELSGSIERAGMMRIGHRLFSTRLEKGVILRARVRGIFLPRHEDTQIAAECYAAFAAAEPPLST